MGNNEKKVGKCVLGHVVTIFSLFFEHGAANNDCYYTLFIAIDQVKNKNLGNDSRASSDCKRQKNTNTMNNSTHVSYESDSCQYAGVSIFFTTVMAIISVAAFIGNILVFVTVYKTPSLRTSTNYYYVNMAVSDFMSSITTWPLYLTDEIITNRGSLIQGPLATTGCQVGVFGRNVSHSVSILSLVLIAVDRFIATVFPLRATLLSKTIRAALLLSTWVISIGWCFPSFYYSKVEKVGHESFCRLALNASEFTTYYSFCLIMIIALLIVIIILYSRIMRVLSTRLQPEYGTKGSSAGHTRNKYNQNVMKIFKSIVVAYFVCWFLFCIYLILKIVFPSLFMQDKCKFILGFAYFISPMLNTIINPVILFSFSSNFRQALKELCAFSFSRCKCRSCWKGGIIAPYQKNEGLPEFVAFKMIEINERYKKSEHTGEQELCVDDRL